MNRTPWKRWAALVLALTLTAAACGGRDDSSSDDSGDGGSGSETTEAGEAAFIDPANDCPGARTRTPSSRTEAPYPSPG